MDTVDNKYDRAVTRVREIRKFYGKLAKFALFALVLVAFNYFVGWTSNWVYILLGFWAFGLILNGLKLYGPNLIFGRDWESRMIEKEMRKEDDTNPLFK